MNSWLKRKLGKGNETQEDLATHKEENGDSVWEEVTEDTGQNEDSVETLGEISLDKGEATQSGNNENDALPKPEPILARSKRIMGEAIDETVKTASQLIAGKHENKQNETHLIEEINSLKEKINKLEKAKHSIENPLVDNNISKQINYNTLAEELGKNKEFILAISNTLHEDLKNHAKSVLEQMPIIKETLSAIKDAVDNKTKIDKKSNELIEQYIGIIEGQHAKLEKLLLDNKLAAEENIRLELSIKNETLTLNNIRNSIDELSLERKELNQDINQLNNQVLTISKDVEQLTQKKNEELENINQDLSNFKEKETNRINSEINSYEQQMETKKIIIQDEVINQITKKLSEAATDIIQQVAKNLPEVLSQALKDNENKIG